MTRDDRPTLRQAEGVDPAEAVTRFLASHGEAWRLQSHDDFEKTLLSRLLDAAGPICLKAARAIRETGPFEACRFAFAPCAAPNPWVAAFKAVPAQGRGMIFGIVLDVPMRESATFRAMAAERAAKREPKGNARDEFADSVIGEILLEEEIAKSLGYPDDLPSPDTVNRIDQFGIYAFGVPREPPGARPGQILASLRDATGEDEESVLRSIGPRGFGPTRIAEARPSWGDAERGTFYASRIDGYKPFAWRQASEALRAALTHLDLMDEMRASAQEVARRRYESVLDREWDIALAEAGAACAALDDGLPGGRAAEVEALLESGCIARRIPGIAEDALRLARAACDLGATGEEDAASYDDLDRSVDASRRGSGLEMHLKAQNGTLAVTIEVSGGRAVGIAAARYGQPLSEYLSSAYGGEDLLSAGAASYKEAHRDYANPDDPLAPLERGEAMAALREGRGGFPGFLGSYAEAADGAWAAKVPAELTLRGVKDLNMLDDCVQAGVAEIVALAETAARGDVRELLRAMALGDAIATGAGAYEMVAADGTRRPAPEAARAVVRGDLCERSADGLFRISAMGRAATSPRPDGGAGAGVAESAT